MRHSRYTSKITVLMDQELIQKPWIWRCEMMIWRNASGKNTWCVVRASSILAGRRSRSTSLDTTTPPLHPILSLSYCQSLLQAIDFGQFFQHHGQNICSSNTPRQPTRRTIRANSPATLESTAAQDSPRGRVRLRNQGMRGHQRQQWYCAAGMFAGDAVWRDQDDDGGGDQPWRPICMLIDRLELDWCVPNRSDRLTWVFADHISSAWWVGYDELGVQWWRSGRSGSSIDVLLWVGSSWYSRGNPGLSWGCGTEKWSKWQPWS